MYFLPKYRRGIYNRYRKGMPVTEMFLKDAGIFVRFMRDKLTGKRTRRLLVFPHYPSRGSTIYRIAKALGYEVTNRPSRSFELAIYWEYGTIRTEYQQLEQLEEEFSVHAINLYNRNISKDFVDELMHKSFGYATKLDPSQFTGLAVRKSLKNAVHDGTLVDCPLQPESGFVYQKFIDSSVNDSEVMDLRIPVMGGNIPHIYLNYRENDQRFKNVPYRAEFKANIDEYLSESEQANILKFCELAHLEFGELDVLRDCHDKQLYIVDANNTPQGPPKNLTDEEKKQALDSYVRCFKDTFIES